MKNTIKRTLTVLLALMLVWAACSVATFAKDYNGTITAGTATAKPGENVDVTITLGEHTGLASLQIDVGYDSDALTLTGVTDAGKLSTFETNTDNLTANPYTLTWQGDLLKSNITYTGVIVTLTFKVKEDADLGDSSITISSHDAMDVDMEDLFFNDVNGKVTITHDHTWKTTWSSDATNHWKDCESGDAKDGVAAHTAGTPVKENVVKPADCTTDGSYDLVTYCSVCGYEMSRVPTVDKAPGHTWAAAWKNDATQHWHICTVCGEIDTKADHTAGEAVKENANTADCTTPASYDNVTYCSICGYKMNTQHVDGEPLGHNLIEEVKDEYKVSDADCTNPAKYAKHCSRCDFVSTEEFFNVGEPKGHTWSEWKNDGTEHWIKCTVCQAAETGRTSHTMQNETVTVKEATCGEQGEYYTVDRCTVCGYETNKSDIMYTNPTGKHTWKETWESDNTRHWHICSVCGNPDKDSYADHTEGNEIIDKEPTTEAEGAWHTECTVCGKVIKTGSIDKLEVYEVTDGNKAVFKKGAKSGVKVTTKVPANGTANVIVKVNGTVVDPANYELTGDNDVAVTLKPEYLETLAKGEYKLEVSDGVGVATSTFTVEEVKAAEDKSPKTGNPVLFWVLLALLANAVLVGSTVYRKKVR